MRGFVFAAAPSIPTTDVPSSPPPQGRNLMAEMVQRNAREFGSRPAVIDPSSTVTWSELADAAQRLAGHLHARGIGPGDVVMWQLPNWWEAIVVAHGVWAAGAISFPVMPIYREHELRQLVDATHPSAVIAAANFRGTDHAAMLRDVCLEASVKPSVWIVVRGRATGWSDFETVVRTSRRHVLSTTDPGAPALLGATSGTTSTPKVVVHSIATFLVPPRTLSRLVGYTWRDRAYMPAPLAHATGLITAVGIPATTGSSTVLRERWEPAQAVSDMRDLGVTFSSGTAVFLHDLVSELSRSGGSKLELSGGYPCGGAPIPESLAEAADDLGLNPSRGYGMTECPIVAYSPPFETRRARCASDGRITDGSEVRVDAISVDGATGGELLVRGPQRALGYVARHDTDEAFDAEGWLRTGDVGSIDDGILTLTGRIKDVINRGGEKISSREIEDLLMGHPLLTEVAVVGAPHARLGEQPAAFVLGDPLRLPTGEDLAEYLRHSGLAVQKVPTIWRFVREFPRTPSGKVRKDELTRDLSRS